MNQTDIGSKLGKLNLLKKANNTEVVTVVPLTNKDIANNSQKVEESPRVSLTVDEINEVVGAKVDAKVSKQGVVKPKKKVSEAQVVTHTKIISDLNFEVSLLCKKNKVFQFHLNNHIYEKLINDKEFMKAMISEIKEKGDSR